MWNAADITWTLLQSVDEVTTYESENVYKFPIKIFIYVNFVIHQLILKISNINEIPFLQWNGLDQMSLW